MDEIKRKEEKKIMRNWQRLARVVESMVRTDCCLCSGREEGLTSIARAPFYPIKSKMKQLLTHYLPIGACGC